MVRLIKLSPDNVVWKKDLAEFDGHIKELDDAPVIARHRPGRRNTHDKSLDARLKAGHDVTQWLCRFSARGAEKAIHRTTAEKRI